MNFFLSLNKWFSFLNGVSLDDFQKSLKLMQWNLGGTCIHKIISNSLNLVICSTVKYKEWNVGGFLFIV